MIVDNPPQTGDRNGFAMPDRFQAVKNDSSDRKKHGYNTQVQSPQPQHSSIFMREEVLKTW